MDLFSKLIGKGKEPEKPVTELKAFVSGKVVPLEEINDGVFSAGMLGSGVAIMPDDETVVAPCAAEVTTVMEGSFHAVGMKLNNGMEVIIHVGLDTIDMAGDGFKAHVKAGSKVTEGQKLITFSKDKIAKAGLRDITILVITNSKDYPPVKFFTDIDAAAGTTVVAEL